MKMKYQCQLEVVVLAPQSLDLNLNMFVWIHLMRQKDLNLTTAPLVTAYKYHICNVKQSYFQENLLNEKHS